MTIFSKFRFSKFRFPKSALFAKISKTVSQQVRLGAVGIFAICLLAIAPLIAPVIDPAYSLLTQPQGDRIFYGKVADTSNWGGTTGDSLVKSAKVTINSSPSQTTYTDANGQFWFQNLRDIPYVISIDTSDRHYSFSVNVDGTIGKFFDLAAMEQENLKELEY